MDRPFIPKKETLALPWYLNFISCVNARLGSLLLPPERVALAAAAVEAYAAAHALANSRPTRTPMTIASKRLARCEAERLCRELAAIIRADRAVSDPELLELGLRSRTPVKTPGCPQTAPLLHITHCTNGVHHLIYCDSAYPQCRAKPAGAANLQLYAQVSEQPAMTASGAVFMCAVTRTPFKVEHAAKDDGRIATYFGRWASGRRGDVGPWSQPVSMRITFASAPMQAA